jgi:hypothetical protein
MELGNIQKYKNTFVFEEKKFEKAPSISYVMLGQTNIILIKASDLPFVNQLSQPEITNLILLDFVYAQLMVRCTQL